jgi:hypothetical protein
MCIDSLGDGDGDCLVVLSLLYFHSLTCNKQMTADQ